jgi:predicted dehydrogenase
MTIKIGVIGAGFIGPAHVEAVRRLGDVEVVALAASSQERAEAKAKVLSIPRAYGNWRDLVADKDVQVVHNTAPNYLHAEINHTVITANKHLLAEKPLGMDSHETRRLVEAANHSPIVQGVCFNYRMYPLTQEMRARAQAGAVGNVRLIHGQYLQDWLMYDTDYNWRVDAVRNGASQAIADIGSHWCDLAQFVTGQRIVAVLADLHSFITTRQRPVGEVDAFATSGSSNTEAMNVTGEDYGAVLLRFENGARGTCLISQISGGHKNDLALEVNGSQATLRWSQENPELLWIGRRNEPNGLLHKVAPLLSDTAKKFAGYPGGHIEGYPDGFKNLVARFYAFIREGRDPHHDAPDFPTFADGHRAALIVDAILQSAREERWITIKETV